MTAIAPLTCESTDADSRSMTVRSVRNIRSAMGRTGLLQVQVSRADLDVLLDRWNELERRNIDRPSTPHTFKVVEGRVMFAPTHDLTRVRMARLGTVEIVDGSLEVTPTRHGDEWGGG